MCPNKEDTSNSAKEAAASPEPEKTVRIELSELKRSALDSGVTVLQADQANPSGLTQLAQLSSGIRVNGQWSMVKNQGFLECVTIDSGQPQRKKYDTCVSPIHVSQRQSQLINHLRRIHKLKVIQLSLITP